MVTVSEKNGQSVTAFPNNPEYGFAVLKSSETIMEGGWLKIKDRTCLIKGQTTQLQGFFTPGKTLPGRIQVVECTEDNIPAKIAAEQLDKNVNFEESISRFIKRAGGEDAPVLMSNDKRILRFTEYDASGESIDVRISHTNGADVAAFNSAKASGSAQLPS